MAHRLQRLLMWMQRPRTIYTVVGLMLAGTGLLVLVTSVAVPEALYVPLVALTLALIGVFLLYVVAFILFALWGFGLKIRREAPVVWNLWRHMLPPRGATRADRDRWRQEQMDRMDQLDVLPVKLADVARDLAAPPKPPDPRPWWRRALAAALLGYGGLLALVIVSEAAVFLFIPVALLSLLLVLWPDRREAADSPLRRWWLREVLTGLYALGLAAESSILALALYGQPGVFFSFLIGFGVIAAGLLLTGGVTFLVARQAATGAVPVARERGAR